LVIINVKQERLFYDAVNPKAKMDDLSSRNDSEVGTPRHLMSDERERELATKRANKAFNTVEFGTAN
jgi:hypothetical protein